MASQSLLTMPRLIIYVPFTRAANGPNQGDLRDNALDLQNQAQTPCVINNINIVQVIAVFAGEEALNPVQAGDILVVHAHGGQNGTGMSDNMGQNVTMNTVLGNLNGMNAGAAAAVFFIVCFSARAGHIAPVWAAAHAVPQPVPVFGAPGIVQGAIALVTRQGTIRNAMFFVGDPRIQQIQ
jgi:hypothetical protein